MLNAAGKKGKYLLSIRKGKGIFRARVEGDAMRARYLSNAELQKLASTQLPL